MKPISLFLVLAVFFFSCERPTDNSGTERSVNTGKIALAFDKQSAPAAVKTLVITVSRSGFTNKERTVDMVNDTAASVVIEGLAAGTWSIIIDAKNTEGVTLYSGKADVLIVENVVSQVNLTLNPVPSGMGSVQINVTWGNSASVFPRTYGGALTDFAMAVLAAKDGGYLLGGISQSLGKGGGDAWVVKTSANGTVLWSKNYGSAVEDRVNSIVQTPDGGYILAGYINGGQGDAWLMKIDSLGNTVWEKNYGVPGDDSFLKIRQVSDGSYLVIGYTYLSDYTTGNWFDGRVVKIAPDGSIIWSTTMGADGGDYTTNFVEIPGNGYYVSGLYGSNFANDYDLWLLKLDLSGKVQWSKTYGNQSEERTGGGMVLTADGNIMFSGYRTTVNGQTGLLIKVDTSGTQQWIKEYPSVAGNLLSMQRLSDNTIVAGGYSYLSGFNQQGVLMKVNSGGEALWTKLYGGSGGESIAELQVTKDQKLVTGGYTSSIGAGGRDYWLMKLNSDGVIQ